MSAVCATCVEFSSPVIVVMIMLVEVEAFQCLLHAAPRVFAKSPQDLRLTGHNVNCFEMTLSSQTLTLFS